ncbi:hypothetical protein Dfri01_56910 [Dyadobacter frigoris]|nr:hypothetical protein [Dyadobacter frigoris]GLU56230.1 hypothetical protein Dfri01_56910 [Dyadobacter frigoris]
MHYYRALHHNGFYRIFPPHVFGTPNRLHLGHNSYYIAGLTQDRIYLGNVTAPLRLFSVNFHLKDPQKVLLKLNQKDSIVHDALRVQVDFPFIYVHEQITPSLFYGNLSDSRLYAVKFPARRLPLLSLFPLSTHQYITRSYDSTLQSNVLNKISISPFTIKTNKKALQKQKDGFFSTDGMLVFDKPKARFVYVYYYRNQYLLCDTALNVLSVGNTIDTNSLAKIEISKIDSDQKTVISAPPLTVNKKICISANTLFIYSNLVTDNENRSVFKHQSVIDVYSLEENRYRYSFYIPDIEGKKVSSFQVDGTTLIVIQDRYLTTFSLNL